MKNRPETDEKKWRKFSVTLDCICVVIAVIIGQILGNRYFGGRLLPVLLLTVGAALIMSFLKYLLTELVYRNETLRKLVMKDESSN